MPDVPGTGGPGLFQGGGASREQPQVETPTEPQALQALEARGTALLLGMLQRLQQVEGILRLERISRLTAEETIRTVVIDNDEAEARIAELENDLVISRSQITDANFTTEKFREAARQFIFNSRQTIFDFVDSQQVSLPNPILARWTETLNVLNQIINQLGV